MDFNRVKRSVENAVSHGDVETLVVLYHDHPEVRELINENTEKIAHVNGLDGAGLSFKDFVVNVYDYKEAKRQYNQGTGMIYVDQGNKGRARNMARVLREDIEKYGAPEDNKRVSNLIVEILAKLGEEYNEDILSIITSDYGKRNLLHDIVTDLNRKGMSSGDFLLLEKFSAYPGVAKVYQGFGYESKLAFAKYYIDKYYEDRGARVLTDLSAYIGSTTQRKLKQLVGESYANYMKRVNKQKQGERNMERLYSDINTYLAEKENY